MNEFDIISTYFQPLSTHRAEIKLGAGDDCALIKVPSDQLLAVSIDTLISGVHFPKDLDPYEIGYKSLAVNLSDLAAMGAEPAWYTCALTLTEIDHPWLKNFTQGLKELSHQFNLTLAGGDLTRGTHLSITIQAQGYVPENAALKRSGAKPGDSIYVSGELGHAVKKNYYHRPEPKISLGKALRKKAHSAIDISDGLIADLSHILTSSCVGASIYLDKIPLVHPAGLFSGDDYELCFTGPENLLLENFQYYKIGQIEEALSLRIYFSENDKRIYTPSQYGYQHF